MRLVFVTFAFAALGVAQDPTAKIFEAIRSNNLAEVKSLAANHVKDRRGNTPLMYAAIAGSVEAMQILVDAGADVNAKNAFDATALLWSATDEAKVKLLVAKGADVNAKSKQGRTPLFLAASSAGTSNIVKYLLEKGARLKDADVNPGLTPLIAASMTNDASLVKLLLESGAEFRGPSGGIALSRLAASGNVEGMKMLIGRGVPVDIPSPPQIGAAVKNGPIALGSFTPLTLAVTYGGPEAVKLLLDNKANPNHPDNRGLTPLMLAVALDHANPKTVKVLLDAGADKKLKSKDGETAEDWARKFQNPPVMAALGLSVTKPAVQAFNAKPLPVKEAVTKSAALLEKTAGSFFTEGGCSSCHSHNLTSVAMVAAKASGFKESPAAHTARVKQTETFWASQDQALLQRDDAPGGSNMVAWGVFEHLTEGTKPNFSTDALVQNIAAQQDVDGSWHTDGFARPPMGDGNFSNTALAIRALAIYGAPGRKADFSKQIQRGVAWLRSATPVSTEDRNMQLLGLAWSGEISAKLKSLAAGIISQQRTDGGWGQTPYLASDAYATGQSLFALKEAGVPVTDAAYKKGMDFLLKTQQADGSWHVISRAPKFQPYFQSGFPYDHDQWISMAGTSWATTALGFGMAGLK